MVSEAYKDCYGKPAKVSENLEENFAECFMKCGAEILHQDEIPHTEKTLSKLGFRNKWSIRFPTGQETIQTPNLIKTYGVS